MDSRRCVELIWARWAQAHRMDPEPILRVAHGRRTSETLREIAPGMDLETEVSFLDNLEETETEGVSPVQGAAALLRTIPPGRWAIVTSGSRAVAALRMRVGGIVEPGVFITAHDVRRGKPSPEGYLLAAGRLGFPPRECVVVEDTPAGIASGKEAGMTVIAVQGTYGAERLSQADVIAPALSALRVDAEPAGWLMVTMDPQASRR